MSPEDAFAFAKRQRAYRIAILALSVAVIVSISWNFIAPDQAEAKHRTEQLDQLVDFNPDIYTKEELADKVRAGQARVAVAYALEYAFCSSQPLMGEFAYAVGQTSIEGTMITTDIDCHLTNGGVHQYSIQYDHLRSAVVIDARQGPGLLS